MDGNGDDIRLDDLPGGMTGDSFAADWNLRADTTYLNHGSFGLPPEPVHRAHQCWLDRMSRQPMDFFVRQLEPLWLAARGRLAELIDAPPDSLAFVDNATYGMNVVASSFPLGPHDEVLLTDHEYGAVTRIWQRAARESDAPPPVIASIPWPLHDPHEVVDAIFSAVTPRTRLIVVSHITSPTALILPVETICEEARRRGIATCVDGPHAIAQVDVSLRRMAPDFYVASLHKWLAAPLGTGFLYVDPKWHQRMRPVVLSWGRLPPTEPAAWWHEFVWRGTSHAAAIPAIPAAIDYLDRHVGLERFRQQTHSLARYARTRLLDRWCTTPWTPDDGRFYGSMACVPIPWGDAASLQRRLWERHGIEVPVIEFQNTRMVRVSCHLYNRADQIDRLDAALAEEIMAESNGEGPHTTGASEKV